MIHKNIFFPALVICLLVCLLMGFVLVLQTLCQKDLYFINKAFLGYDYYNFYQASICVENGLSPYAFPLHMVPPIPSILGTPLVPLGFLNARWIIVILVLLTTIFFYWIMVSYFAPKETQDKWAILACGFASLFLSYPFLFLLDRANVDSFAVFFMCLLLVYSHKSVLLSGMLLTLAVCFKVYPALLLLPLAIFKKNKILLWSGIFLLIFIAITPGYWVDFLNRISSRRAYFRTDENGSIACTFFWIGSFAESILFLIAGWKIDLALFFNYLSSLCYAGLLITILWIDVKSKEVKEEKDYVWRCLWYFPFMVAIPQLAHHYELVILFAMIPAICHLWVQDNTKTQQIFLMLICVGIALAQTQAVAMQKLTQSMIPHFIPGFGLFLVMIGCTFYKVSSFVVKLK